MSESAGASGPQAASRPVKSTATKKHSGADKIHYDFFGPHVPLLLTFVLPAVLYGLYFGCNSQTCLKIWPKLELPSLPEAPQWYSVEAFQIVFGWFFGLMALHLILPGKRVQGVVLPDGSRLTYKLNSFLLFVLTYGAATYLAFIHKTLNLGYLYDAFLPLTTATIVLSSLLSLYLYLASFKRGAMLSAHGATGWPWYDFWMGRELNPRIGPLDLKEFCELYPGLIGWTLLNLGMAHKQWSTLGYVTNSMVLVNAFQLYYVGDAVWNEPSILTTMDITTDGFGFMLAFGDLAWVPVVFTCSARFLVHTPLDLPLWGVVLVLAVKALGYWIFRGANGQKDQFRRDPTHPSVSHLKTMPTTRGTKLIISGWWGTARHINYLGDWIMGVAWCMPCGLVGLRSVVPYFYCIYFASLLIHRERRDEAACRAKYGADWDKYCRLVPYRIIPYVY